VNPWVCAVILALCWLIVGEQDYKDARMREMESRAYSRALRRCSDGGAE
jgi:hypothetical protein